MEWAFGMVVIRWENGWGGLGGWITDFSLISVWYLNKKFQKKSVVYPPDPPNPFSHRITLRPVASRLLPCGNTTHYKS
jgi:hypothetical protein